MNLRQEARPRIGEAGRTDQFDNTNNSNGATNAQALKATTHGQSEAMGEAERAKLQRDSDTLGDRAKRVKLALSNPVVVAKVLALEGQPSSGGFMARCLYHEEQTPSMSLRIYPDGIGVHCFGCKRGGDVLDLIARRAGVDVRRDFASVVTIGENLAQKLGADATLDIACLQGQGDKAPPPESEVYEFWHRCAVLSPEDGAERWCATRAIDPFRVTTRQLAKVLPAAKHLPAWARYRGRSWLEAGYQLIVPTYGPDGLLVSVHARATRDVGKDQPKSLWPAGYAAAGIMANSAALDMLRRPFDQLGAEGARIFVCEGVPDFLTYATIMPESDAVFGLTTAVEFSEFASWLPAGSHVYIHPHPDEAGRKYTRDVLEALRERVLAGTVTVYIVKHSGGADAAAA